MKILSNKHNSVNPMDYDIFVGLDVDKRNISLTVVDHYGLEIGDCSQLDNPRSIAALLAPRLFAASCSTAPAATAASGLAVKNNPWLSPGGLCLY